MANLLSNLFRGSKPPASPEPVRAPDSDFADFTEGADPTPAHIPFQPESPSLARPTADPSVVPYTKWYNVHERHSLNEFRNEGIILACIAVVLAFHLFGASLNRSKGRKWIRAHAAPLASEFALVGFAGFPPPVADKKGDELVRALEDAMAQQGDAILKEKSLFEFATYASGRANTAFMDVKLTLLKRFNPLTVLIESVTGFFWEKFDQPQDTMQAVIYPFDGLEALMVPGVPGATELRKDSKSAYDGFVWALVNKECMKQLRDDRYDLSITITKDSPKLPSWLTVMSESAEITEAMLTPDLIKAAEQAGEQLQYLIISDQPVDQPKSVSEAATRKRIFLKYHLPSNDEYVPLLPVFKYFMRMPDLLVQTARFRPEVMRKLKLVREEALRRLSKAAEDEKAEERIAERERQKKAKRDQELDALDAKAQKKYLDKEREKQMRRSTKKMTTRG